MKEYHKIQTVFKRNPETNFRTLLIGEWSLPEFEYLKNCQWIFTEKVDGTNIRVMFDGEYITFGGKTDNAQIPSFLINKLNELFLPQIKMFKDNFKDGGMPLRRRIWGKDSKGWRKLSTGSKFCPF